MQELKSNALALNVRDSDGSIQAARIVKSAGKDDYGVKGALATSSEDIFLGIAFGNKITGAGQHSTVYAANGVFAVEIDPATSDIAAGVNLTSDGEGRAVAADATDSIIGECFGGYTTGDSVIDVILNIRNKQS